MHLNGEYSTGSGIYTTIYKMLLASVVETSLASGQRPFLVFPKGSDPLK